MNDRVHLQAASLILLGSSSVVGVLVAERVSAALWQWYMFYGYTAGYVTLSLRTAFYFLLGEDNVTRLHTWHRFAELSEMVQFIVLERTGLKTEHPYPIIRRHVDISATDIRNRVASGHSIRYLVPSAVEKIIHDRQLYREP